MFLAMTFPSAVTIAANGDSAAAAAAAVVDVEQGGSSGE
jgi:hypothetical protein